LLISSMVGAALLARGDGVDEAYSSKKMGDYVSKLMREWDRNKDGELSKQEFKASMRTSLHLKADSKEIDSLFDSLDVDGGGTLDLKEIRVALQKLIDAARSAALEDEAMRSRGELANQRAVDILRALHATMAFESEEARLQQLKDKPGVDHQLGEAFLVRARKGDTSVEDLIQTWKPVDDETQIVGEDLDKAHFIQQAIGMLSTEEGKPSAALRAEVSELFEQMMIYQAVVEEHPHGSKLNLAQLERLPALAKERREEISRQGTLCNSLRRAAARLQAGISESTS